MPAIDKATFTKYRRYLRSVRWCQHRKHRTNKKRDARKYGCKGGKRCGRWLGRAHWPWPMNRLRSSEAYSIFGHPDWMYETGAALQEETFEQSR